MNCFFPHIILISFYCTHSFEIFFFFRHSINILNYYLFNFLLCFNWHSNPICKLKIVALFYKYRFDSERSVFFFLFQIVTSAHVKCLTQNKIENYDFFYFSHFLFLLPFDRETADDVNCRTKLYLLFHIRNCNTKKYTESRNKQKKIDWLQRIGEWHAISITTFYVGRMVLGDHMLYGFSLWMWTNNKIKQSFINYLHFEWVTNC